MARYMDLGQWAVLTTANVGIYPYVLTFLKQPMAEMRETLLFIWSRLLSFDVTCATELVSSGTVPFFVAQLEGVSLAASATQNQSVPAATPRATGGSPFTVPMTPTVHAQPFQPAAPVPLC